MLVYFDRGIRRYYEQPVRVLRRDAWEFQFVLRGEIGLVTTEGPDILKKNHLWISRPDFCHGWTGLPGKEAEMAVFHFTHLPDDLTRCMFRDSPVFCRPVGAPQRREVLRIAEKVERYWQRPIPGRMLCFQEALCQLSLMALEFHANESPESPAKPSKRRVSAALKWFSGQIAANPTLEEVASTVGSSTAQLRRDFHSALQMSPKEAFDDIRFKKALEYLQSGEASVEDVADKVGFGSASAFARAFKAKIGMSPRRYLSNSTSK